MKIVHYTSAHPWSSTRIFSKMCVHLGKLGHQVALVAVDPEASELLVFERDGIEVHLLPGLGRTSRFQRATYLARQVTRYAQRLDPDILQFHDPELIPYTVFDLKAAVPLVFDAHEDFVSQMDNKFWAKGITRMLLKIGLRALQKLINFRATYIIAATEGVRKSYSLRKSSVIRNLPILAEFTNVNRKSITERPRDVCYVGAISRVRGIVQLVSALEKSEQVERLHLAGRFESEALRCEIEAMPGWSKVNYLGYINRDEIAELLGRVRVGMVTLHPTPNHLHSIPIKLLEYLCAGVPAIASNFPYWTEFIRDGETGVFVDPMDALAIARALDQILGDSGAAKFENFVSEEVQNRFSWESEVLDLEKVYRLCMK
jgi:glycosyltransferase involved in cell wall biosynthesis